jgi:hypothetical protein
VARSIGPELAERWAWDAVARRFDALVDTLAAR